MKNEPSNNESHRPADLELEARLTRALAQLPDTTVASNFTARVMQAVEVEESRRQRRWNFIFDWHAFLPRAAVVTAAIVFAGLTFHHHEIYNQHAQAARSVASALASETPMPSVDALNNFDAIQRMSQPAHADEELLALMQ